MKRFFLIPILSCLFSSAVSAQEAVQGTAEKEANNPLASIKSVSLHNVFTPSIYGAEGTMNTGWIRYAQPIGRLLVRASLPIVTMNRKGAGASGLGDLNLFATYVLTRPSSPDQFGIGPIISFPTATSKGLGTGRWQAGVALVAYFARNDRFQFGLLATWQHSFAGQDNSHPVHAASIQPFFTWQLGKGAYFRSSAIAVLDFGNSSYCVPIGLGAGKVFKVGKVIFNIFAEPQFTVWHWGGPLPETQILIGVNTQF